MTLRHTLLGMMALLVAGLLAGCVASSDLVTRQVLEDAQRRRERAMLPSPTLPPTPIPPTPTATLTPTPRPGRTWAQVLRVWDGNTILIDGGYSVRYIGVASPGAGMYGRPVEPFGREAADRNIDLVEGRMVELEADAADLDPAGNLLRWVYVDDVLVNDQLIREGLARVGPMGRNTRYQDLLREAEAEAHLYPVNMWTIVTATPVPTREPTDTPLPRPPPQPSRTPFPSNPGVPRSAAIRRSAPTETPVPPAPPTRAATSTLPATASPPADVTPTAATTRAGAPPNPVATLNPAPTPGG